MAGCSYHRHLKTFAVLIAVTAGVPAANLYSNSNRDLFGLPRSAGLGGADLSLVRDGVPGTNPANLTLDSTSELALSYARYYDDVFSTSSFSFVTTAGSNGALGISLSYLLVPDIEITTNLPTDIDGNPVYDPSLLEYRSSSEIFLHVGYGHVFHLNRRIDISAGVALNALRRRLLDWAGYGIGLDAGVNIAFHKPGIYLGLLCRNLTTNYLDWGSGYDESALPQVNFGFGWHREIAYIEGHFRFVYSSPDLLVNDGINATTFLADGDSLETPQVLHPSRDPEFLLYGNYGMEFLFARRVSIRAGLVNLRNMVFGAGYMQGRGIMAFDFAYVLHELGGNYSASATIRFPPLSLR